MTGARVVDRVQVAELQLGSSTIHNLQLPALREDGSGRRGHDRHRRAGRAAADDGFRKAPDQGRGRAASRRKMVDGEIVVRARRQRGQLILTEVRAAGLPLEAVIDTGSEITIGNFALRDKLIRGNEGQVHDVKATGVTGVTVDLQLARIGELELGSVTLQQRADGLRRRSAVRGVRPVRTARAAARHRPSGNVSPGVARFSGAQGPLPAAEMRDDRNHRSVPRPPRLVAPDRRETIATCAEGSGDIILRIPPALVYYICNTPMGGLLMSIRIASLLPSCCSPVPATSAPTPRSAIPVPR